ncbi:Ig-like domain-containing protein [Pseudescherichia sp.]|uniref:Ig-like domain-containing protein n=1 Tax=Pseudescherichia sp. TaxID=2055881 RepID=UPI00289B0A20|nr:Ig-like domain-containing protein [Pseudescherichia sp.]
MSENTLFSKLRRKRAFIGVVWLQAILQAAMPLVSIASMNAHAETQAATTPVSPFSVDRASAPASLPGSENFSTVASALSSTGTSGLTGAATSAATGYAASSVQEWLSQFGTARVLLNVDDNGNWDDSAFDFLAPLYDNQKSVLFSQVGLRSPDDRLTGNFGLGVRTFYLKDWMLGGNVFFDDDFTGKNRRISFGSEAWTDYLKLAGNVYVGTTDWHSSRDFDDYNEKPADGFDVRAEGYLPAYPQLGVKAMYEQYHGDDVALFDTDHLQSNPSAVTLGVNYTPVPLITAGVDYKRGQDSMDETRFSLNFRYALGQSLESQLSSDQVAFRRSLAGSRYDLVDRNNEIVLQYKKKQQTAVLSDLAIYSAVDGSPADGKTANTVTVHAIDNNGDALKNVSIAWSITGQGKLSSATGITDANGNASVNVTNTTAEQNSVSATSGAIVRSTTTTFVQSVASLNLKLTKNNSQADGQDQNAGQVTVKDANDQAMSGVAISWKVDNGATIASSDAVTNSSGQASVHFTSSQAGTVKLTATAAGKTETVSSAFQSADVSALKVTMSKNNAPADGISTNVAQAQAVDDHGNLLAGKSITWTLGKGSAVATTPMTSITDQNGIATLTLTDKVAESQAVTATADGVSGQTQAVFNAVSVSAIDVSVTANNVPADGASTNGVRAVVTDSKGNPMPGVDLTWSLGSSHASATTPLSVTTDANGVATLSLTDTVAETVTVNASAGGQQGSASVTFIQVDVKGIDVSVITNNAPNDGASTNDVQAVVTDSKGNLMSGVSLTWSLGSSHASATTPLSVTTDANGVAKLSLTDTVAETVPVKASAGGQEGSVNVTFTQNDVNSITVKMTTNSSPADGVTENIAQAQVLDDKGQPMQGVDVTWSVSGNAKATSSLTAVTDANGYVTLNVVDTTVESVTLTASAGGKSGQVFSIFTEVPADNVAVTMLTDGAMADGKATDEAQAVVTDKAGAPMPNVQVIWSISAGNAVPKTSLTVNTDENGIAKLSFVDTTAESLTITAAAGGKTGQTTASFIEAGFGPVTIEYPKVRNSGINHYAVEGGLTIRMKAWPGMAAGDQASVHFVIKGEIAPDSPLQVLPDYTSPVHTVTADEVGSDINFTVPQELVDGLQPLEDNENSLVSTAKGTVVRPSTGITVQSAPLIETVDTIA